MVNIDGSTEFCTCETCQPTHAPGDYAPKTDPQWAAINDAIEDSLLEVEMAELLGSES